MSNCDCFQTQVASVLAIVAKSAVAEMSNIVNEGSSVELCVEESANPVGTELMLQTIEPPTVSETKTVSPTTYTGGD